ncbi:unnamed protein product, partial [Didymodactylos carnosus]
MPVLSDSLKTVANIGVTEGDEFKSVANLL